MPPESCAACGKADISLKACKSCMTVKYCGRECQISHWSRHKKACRQKARELFDMKLFAEHQRGEDCPICYLPMPCDIEADWCYMACCGKSICVGCVCCLTRDVCPFCNTPAAENNEEHNKMLKERIERFSDANAMNTLGGYYDSGRSGFPVDQSKAVELFQRASELGSANAHLNLGGAYLHGEGVQVDKKKAIYHYQLSAMLGSIRGRYYLGLMEAQDGNQDRAIRHFIIAAKYGDDMSLQMIKDGFTNGVITKEDFEKTLRGHKASQAKTKSDQRDRAREMNAQSRYG
eukprot:scaffold64434_cov52-Cyclotella_meneghiniana.AAC.10